MNGWIEGWIGGWMNGWMDGFKVPLEDNYKSKPLTVTEKYYPFLVNTQKKVLYDDRIYTNYGFHINRMEIF